MPPSVLNSLSKPGPGLLPGLFRNNEMIILSSKLGRNSTAKKAKRTLHLLQFYPSFSLSTPSWSGLANMFAIARFIEFFFHLVFLVLLSYRAENWTMMKVK